MSKRVWAGGAGIFDTQTIITENRVTVIAKIKIVPTTSDTPDLSSRIMTLKMRPPCGRDERMSQPLPRYIKDSWWLPLLIGGNREPLGRQEGIGGEIGRASCRERVGRCGGAG